MKICWDMLEGVYLSEEGNLKKGRNTYIYKGACAKCGESYLTIKSSPSKFCSKSCVFSGENHYLYGKTPTIETRKKMSIANRGKNNPMYGKTHTAEIKKKLSAINIGKTVSVETRKKISKSVSGLLNPNYKGGIYTMGLTVYDTYKDRLPLYEETRKQEGTEVLEVKCTYCGVWYSPTYDAVNSRLYAINSLNQGECRLYCSENCKQACPTYNQKMYPKGFKKATSREVSTYLRQMCFERDNWECQICGKTIKDVQLHCHHINGYAQNKILANDIDNVITLCKECHKKVHKLPGCRYVDLRCEEK